MELRDKVRGMALDRKVAKVTLVGVPDRPGIAAVDLRAAGAARASTST